MRSGRPAGHAAPFDRLLALLLAAGAPACGARHREVARLPPPPVEVEWLTAAADTRSGFWLSPDDAIEWDVPAGPARRLSGAYESSMAGIEPGSLEFALSSRPSKAAALFWRSGLPLTPDPGRWRAWSLEIPGAEEPVRLSISYRDPKPGSEARSLFLTTPSLEGARRGRPRTIVLMLVDTLRADRVSAYGIARETTPQIDAWFRRGLRAETCFPEGNWTLPSHASLLTSTPVARHGVGRYGHTLPDGLETLAGSLASAGYRTLAVTGGGYVDASFGFARGFDRYTVVPGRAARAVESALSLLEQHRGERVFLFLHTYQVHDYAPDEAAARRLFPDLSVLGPDWQGSIGTLSRTRMSDPRLTGWVRARYDAALRSVDDAFGGLLEGLEAQGRLPETGILLTSDHGEAMCDRTFRGECLEWGHGSPYLFEEELRVPLLARFPWRKRAEGLVPGITTLLDVAPTIVDAAGVSPPSSFEGRSLLDLRAPAARIVATEAPPHDAVALREGSQKRIRRTGVPQRSVFDPTVFYYRMPVDECFDLARDPGEIHPVPCQSPPGAALSNHLDRYIVSSFPGSLVLRVPAREFGGGRRQAFVRARGRARAPAVRTFGLEAPAELAHRGAVTEARFWVGLAPVWLGIEPLDGSRALEIEIEGLSPIVAVGARGVGPGDYRWPDLAWPPGRDLPRGVAFLTTPPAPRPSSTASTLSTEVAARLLSLGYLRGAPELSGKLDPAAAARVEGAPDLAPGQVRVLRAD